MTNTTPTLICTLAAGSARLTADIKRAEKEGDNIRQRDWKNDGLACFRIKALEEFCSEAYDRLDAIEQFLCTLRPQSLEDALILSSVAAGYANRPHTVSNARRIQRILAEIATYLAKHTSGTAHDLGADIFCERLNSWEDEQAKISDTTAEDNTPAAELKAA